ncbi:MAG: hypothetical protein P9L97_00885 [Candidatus Tenebribacter davisii]|nr:hypothetical protein [Candidatus Tenebribacter davisii]
MKKQEYNPISKVSDEEWDDFKILTNDDPDFWFSAARWSKETNEFSLSERKFIFKIGTNLKKDNPLTEKQLFWANKLYRKIISCGFRFQKRGKGVIFTKF